MLRIFHILHFSFSSVVFLSFLPAVKARSNMVENLFQHYLRSRRIQKSSKFDLGCYPLRHVWLKSVVAFVHHPGECHSLTGVTV